MITECQKMENVLDQQIEGNLLVNTRAKLSFLQDEKERLQTAIEQLNQNNNLLRTINQQIISQEKYHQQSIIASLNNQNAVLQKNYTRILKQNQHLSSSLLLLQQIMDETSLEQNVIIKDYEAKIIQLRRLIQIKQSHVQQLEKKSKNEGSILVPPTNVNLLFFNEIEELKKMIDVLTTKNNSLENENLVVKKRNDALEKKMNLMEILTLRSKLMYEQFKYYYTDETRKRYSAPKRGTILPFKRELETFTPKKLNEGQTKQTRQFSECQPYLADTPIKMLLYKSVLEVQKLKQSCHELKNALIAERSENHRLASIHKQQTQRASELARQLAYYKQSTQYLLRVLTYRKEPRDKSLERLKIEKNIQGIKVSPRKHFLSDRKLFWTTIQQKMKLEKMKVLQIKKIYRKTMRSISCVKDYRSKEVDDAEYVPKKKIVTEQKKKKMSEDSLEHHSRDFTLMMDDPLGVDISIIGSSSAIKEQTNTYDKKPNKKAILPDLSLLDENIL